MERKSEVKHTYIAFTDGDYKLLYRCDFQLRANGFLFTRLPTTMHTVAGERRDKVGENMPYVICRMLGHLT
jgi:hypothetical protein